MNSTNRLKMTGYSLVCYTQRRVKILYIILSTDRDCNGFCMIQMRACWKINTTELGERIYLYGLYIICVNYLIIFSVFTNVMLIFDSTIYCYEIISYICYILCTNILKINIVTLQLCWASETQSNEIKKIMKNYCPAALDVAPFWSTCDKVILLRVLHGNLQSTPCIYFLIWRHKSNCTHRIRCAH